MAGAGWRQFNTGDVLTASQVQNYLQDQTVLVFDDSSDRSTTLGTNVSEGMISYLKDTNAVERYDGSTWGAIGAGDIEGVTAGAGLTGGGTSGTVTLTNDMAVTITAKGDLLVGTGNATYDNLPVGTNGYTLVADSSETTGLKWAAPAGGGKVLQVVYATYSTSTTVASTSFTDTGLTVSITPTSASSTILIFVNQSAYGYSGNADTGLEVRLLRGSTAIYTPGNDTGFRNGYVYAAGATSSNLGVIYSFIYRDSPATTSSTSYKTQGRSFLTSNNSGVQFQGGSSVSSICLMEIGA